MHANAKSQPNNMCDLAYSKSKGTLPQREAEE